MLDDALHGVLDGAGPLRERAYVVHLDLRRVERGLPPSPRLVALLAALAHRTPEGTDPPVSTDPAVSTGPAVSDPVAPLGDALMLGIDEDGDDADLPEDLRAAEAYANAGETAQCRAAVDAAFEHLVEVPSASAGPDWAYWLTSTHAHGQAGYCYLRLKDWSRARSHLRAALHEQGSATSREGALRQTLMAITYVRQSQPDLERALALGSRATGTLREQVESPRCLGHLRTLADCLEPYRRTPKVRGFCDEVRTLVDH